MHDAVVRLIYVRNVVKSRLFLICMAVTARPEDSGVNVNVNVNGS
jgi:hypothetical protein